MQVQARAFGEEWAKAVHGDAWSSAAVWGMVTGVGRRGGRRVILTKYPGDTRVYHHSEVDIVSFQIIKPSDFDSEPSESEARSSRGRVIRRKATFDESDSEESVQEVKTKLPGARGRPRTRPISTSTTTPCAPLAAMAHQPDEIESDDGDLDATSVEPPPGGKDYEYFPVTTACSGDTEDMFVDANKTPHARFLPSLKCTYASGSERSPLIIFKTMLPTLYFEGVVLRETNKALLEAGKNALSAPEWWKYIGLRIAMAKFPGLRLAEFWRETETFLRPALKFGKFMPRDRFEEITSNLIFVSGSSVDDPLFPVRTMFTAFNTNMRHSFSPSWIVCVDESMSKWTNKHTIPNWVFIPRKPCPSGQEWHDAACGLSNVIFALEAVEQSDRIYDTLSKMTGVVLRLIEMSGLQNDKPRVIVGDSAFPSIVLLKELASRGLYGIFAFKKKAYWPKGIPGAELLAATQSLPLGSSVHIKSDPTKSPQFIIAGLRDLNPCLVMSTASSMSINPTSEFISRYVKTPAGSTVSRSYQRPEVFDLYYRNRHSIDDANNLRMGRESIEDGWNTKNWTHRSFAFLLGICETNAYNYYRFKTEQLQLTAVTHDEFREQLCQELLDNVSERSKLATERCDFLVYPRDKILKAGKFLSRAVPTKGAVQKQCATGHQTLTTRYCACDITRPLCWECWKTHFEAKMSY